MVPWWSTSGDPPIKMLNGKIKGALSVLTPGKLKVYFSRLRFDLSAPKIWADVRIGYNGDPKDFTDSIRDMLKRDFKGGALPKGSTRG